MIAVETDAEFESFAQAQDASASGLFGQLLYVKEY